jgi:hypothetical protein
MRLRAGSRSVLRASLLLGVLGVLVGARGPHTCAAVYVLGKDSHVIEGCLDPCECPVLLHDDLRGILLVEPIVTSPASPIRQFEVKWLLWFYGSGERTTFVTGQGTYEVGGEFGIQERLVLDLRVGDEPVTRYDSGLVVGGSDTELFPPIEIEIARNGFFCYDRVFSLQARPLGAG